MQYIVRYIVRCIVRYIVRYVELCVLKGAPVATTPTLSDDSHSRWGELKQQAGHCCAVLCRGVPCFTRLAQCS